MPSITENLCFIESLSFFVFLLPLHSWARVRTVEVKKDQIVTVKTAIGIATIIQVPDRPNSIVVGDQNAFKVEYLDQAITIKPLQGGAKSNLYIYTDYQRFSVQLVTAQEAAADYVVYLANSEEKAAFILWKKFKGTLKNENLTIEVKRIAKTKDEVLLMEFDVFSEKNEKLEPKWIWLTQNGATKPIHSLSLSSLELKRGTAIHGVMQILKSDISETEPLKIEVRRKKASYLIIPKATSWK